MIIFPSVAGVVVVAHSIKKGSGLAFNCRSGRGAYPQAAWARSQRGLPLSAFRRNTNAPPVRQAPTIHGVQLVSPSRRSVREPLGPPPSEEYWQARRGVQNDYLAARSCSRGRSSCFAFRAAAPARPAATFFGSLTFSITLSTGELCAGSSAVSWFSCFVSSIVYSNRAAVSKLAVLQGG